MNRIKEVFKENWIAIIILVVILVAAGVYMIVVNVRDSKQYNSPFTTPDEIPYENKKYEENEYMNIVVSDQDVALRYYSFIRDNLLKPEVLYEMLDSKEKNKYQSIEDFKRMLKKFMTLYTPYNNLVKWGVKEINSLERTFVVVDSESNSYTIHEKGMWNITIEFDGKVDLENFK